MAKSTTPTGATWVASAEAHAALWSIWFAVAPIALARGEGVMITIDADSAILETVYAPNYERIVFEVRRDGEVSDRSDSSAPRVDVSWFATAFDARANADRT